MKTTTEISRATPWRSATIKTSLYELVEALNAAVDTDEEDLVVPLVIHLLQTGRAKFISTTEPLECN
jgi:hypothetical protein